MARLLQIAEIGHPVLREKALPVNDVRSPDIQSLIDDMLATLEDLDGAGIAAPQVYESHRMIVVASRPSPRYPDAPELAPEVMVNPELVWSSDTTEKGWEACLSVPGLRALVPRSKSIRVRYTTRDGKPKAQEFSDFVARVFLHEFDHLDGLVYLDRVESNRDIISEKEYQKMDTDNDEDSEQ
jgi:peptide deformylase